MSTRRKQKPGRNDQCPCGSGKKFKRCHGTDVGQFQSSRPPIVNEVVQARLAEIKARQLQREQQQGLGHPIISESFQGYRIVAVGSRIYYSKKWQTFHDFLFHYITSVLRQEWGNAELAKPESDRHPLLRLYGLVAKFRREQGRKSGAVKSVPMTGAIAAYLGLVYNLYLLAHNVTLQDRLLSRLKDPAQFHGAVYETYVAGAFIKAGFRLALEDETDPSTSHCEFAATSSATGRIFSVEAKGRRPGKPTAHVSNQLYAALKKQAPHTRVVFIDVNVPAGMDTDDSLTWLHEALGSIRSKERTMTIQGRPAPDAYVVLTNHPYQYQLEIPVSGVAVAAEGFKIPDFKVDSTFRNIRDARVAREKHREMYDLIKSMLTHYEIPSTFDGEIPEFAFGEGRARLLIGGRYLVPVDDGTEVPGTLEEATVSEPEAKAYGVFRLDDGRRIIVSCDLTPEELVAYSRHPDTFFGIHRRQGRHASSALELFDFFFETYRKSTKDKLLEFMQDHPDISDLRTKDQEELAVLYCERLTEAAVHSASNREQAKSEQ